MIIAFLLVDAAAPVHADAAVMWRDWLGIASVIATLRFGGSC